MKRFSLLVLCSILAFPGVSVSGGVSNIGSLVESLIAKFGSNQVYSEHCVSDCQTLGYETSKDDLNGRTDCTACPFDLDCNEGKTISTPKWFNCPTYSCEDLGLLSKKPAISVISTIRDTDMGSSAADDATSEVTILSYDCKEIEKPGLKGPCYSCQCPAGTLNTTGCEEKLNALKNSADECSALGYRNSVTECENYIACPSDPNKVHCLNDLCSDGENGCTQEVEVPEHATTIGVSKQCCDGSYKPVITDFICEVGYVLSKDKKTCEEAICPDNQFTGPMDAEVGATYQLEDCSENMADGWSKVKTDSNGICYRCACTPDKTAYPYTRTLDSEVLTDVACDDKHFRTCDCPVNEIPQILINDEMKELFEVVQNNSLWEWKKPADDAIIAKPIFSTCCKSENAEEKHNYVSSFECYEENGWVLTETKETCEASFCNGEKNGVYYSGDYTSDETCNSAFGTSGWTYTHGKSGGANCGRCTCTARDGDFTEKDSENMSLVEYSEPVCDGVHYNKCSLKADLTKDYQKKGDFLTANPNIDPKSMITIKLCKEDYVLKTGVGCKEGYQPDGQGGCIENVCEEKFNLSESAKKALETEAETNGHAIYFEECRAGSTKFYQLTSCGDNTTNYAVAENKTSCCQLCNTEEGWSTKTSIEGKKQDGSETSTCDKNITCYHYVDEEKTE